MSNHTDREPTTGGELIRFPAGSTPEIEVSPYGVILPTEPAAIETEPLDPIEAGSADPIEPTDDAIEPAPEVFEGEIVDDAPALRWQQPITRRPVIAPWLADARQRRDATLWAAGQLWHATKYHAVRAPLYAGRLLGASPRGTFRLAAAWARWAFDREGAPVRQAAVEAADANPYLALSKQRNERVRLRLSVSAWLAAPVVLWLAALAVLPPALTSWARPPAWACWTAAAAIVAVAGVVGRRHDKPIVTAARSSDGAVPKLTPDVVTRALGALGIANINQTLARGELLNFAGPITRDGPGWRADVDLPLGVTAADVIERRGRLASGLRRPLGCVWPEAAHHAHEGRLVLWVGDKDMSQAKPAAWPLAKTGKADLFTPVPFGVDQRGRAVSILLMFASVLIGAMPRQGKTFALRVLLLAAALDPRAELRVFELKGSGDLAAAELVAHRYASGPDDATIEQTVISMREMYAELETRAKTISKLPRELCPENKVTPELAGRRTLGLFPLVLIVDECQQLFSHPEYGKEAAELAVAIIKRGPAFGVILMLATQRPDKDSLPTGVSANIGIRFCLRVMGQIENDMVLGTSAYRNGIRATTFTDRDKGIGYLVGVSDDAQIARSAYIDGPTADKIAQRARLLREQAGTLSGYALGERPTVEPASVDVLAAVAGTFAAGEDRLWSETIVTRLAELRPDAFGDWQPAQLAAVLKPYGIKPTQVWATGPDGQRANRRGYLRTHILDALSASPPSATDTA